MFDWSKQQFLLGSHLCREPMPPMSEMKRDMETLKTNAFNMIKLQEHWMIDEPTEGEYDFSRYEELIDYARTLDLGVYLGLTCEQAPHWLYEKHPECRMVRRDGSVVNLEAQTTLSGSDGKPGPCCDHPGALNDQLRFIGRLVETLGRFENVVVWNTWQEVGYWEWVIGGHVCYCPNTLAAYRAWLRERYGDLDNLNRLWNSRYVDWGDILPDRMGRVAVTAHEMNWRYFMDNVQTASLLRARAEAIRAADPFDRPVFAHKGGPAFAAGQDWTYARCQDFLGTSCYPAWGFGRHGWDDDQGHPVSRENALFMEMWTSVAHGFDHIRCANGPDKPVWAAEFQGGPVSTGFHKGRVPSAADIRRWMLTAVGSGATAISFWVTRAEIMAAEQNGFSLLDSEGDSTSRLAEAGRIGRALDAHAELFARPTFEPASVGVLVNEWNYQFCTELTQGGGHLAYGTRGWYRLLLDLNVPMDFISVEHDLDRIDSYDALILPFPLSLSNDVAARLAAYVQSGGNLISEAAPGRMNEHAFCVRGEILPTLASLFGVRQRDFTMVREPDGGQRWSPPERTWGEYLDATDLRGEGPMEGERLRSNVYLQTFEIIPGSSAVPVLRAGDAIAGVRRQVGAGQAWLLGTYVGHNGTAYRDPAIHAGIRTMLAVCGVTPIHDGKLLLRKRVLPDREAWIFTNPTGDSVTETVSIEGWKQVGDLLDQSLTLNGNDLELTVEGLDIRVVMVER